MPQAPLRPCPHVGCKELTRGGRCDKHKREQQRQHEGTEERLADQRFYNGTRWRKLREVKLGRDPLCQECKRQGRTKLAQEVHHLIPRKRMPEMAYVMSNLESLCTPCHSKETAKEQGWTPNTQSH